MKLILTLTLMLLLLTVPAFSELTPADIDKIRLIVKEEVEQAVTTSEARLRKEIEGPTRTARSVAATDGNAPPGTYCWP